MLHRDRKKEKKQFISVNIPKYGRKLSDIWLRSMTEYCMTDHNTEEVFV